jgi:uncharacterized protein
MPLRNGYIPGVPCWVDASEPEPQAAVDFYSDLFGWQVEDRLPPDSGGHYFIARHEATTTSIFDLSRQKLRGDVAGIRSIPESAPAMAMWNTYFWVDSADEAASNVKDAGGSVVTEPFEFIDACRMAVCTDPEGAAFGVWEAKNHKGAQLVNDPGAPVFNGLNTRDVEAARSFYAAVFGWQTASIGAGSQGWTLPGYGDWLEQEHHPDLRKQMADAGAPQGFEDVVAAIVPIADDQPDTPAHWGVTFATDDADATADKAAELGGTVIVSPFDAPWSTSGYTIRLTILADPQGATFSASRFIPQNMARPARRPHR